MYPSKEMLAAVWAVKTIRPYLHGQIQICYRSSASSLAYDETGS